MGLVLGKITVETPKYQVVNKTTHYEIRKYEPSVIAEVTYDPQDMKGDPDGGFKILANYIGAFGKPQNTKPEQIAMTAPVITQESAEKIAMTAPVITQESAEKIAMTAPVITQEAKPQPESIAMTAPVVTKSDEGKKLMTMQFVLPGSKYSKLEDVPRPADPRVVIKQVKERKYAVVTFSGVANDKVVHEKLLKLKAKLEEDGCKIVEEHLLARYNPPWTLPPLRTNEIFVPVEGCKEES
ncbi:hypothetical protein EJ110_NYTH32178 [Nymphaea thermarum]|nr:hypothetical protein EJ110_NYTH32178 [Nymphaea thermarum]